MATATHLVTVAEFSTLLDDDGPFYTELHNGEIVEVPRPKNPHFQLQRSIRDLLSRHAAPEDLVKLEVAFCPVSEYELRVADVAWLSAKKWEVYASKDYICGSPELVVEVLSLSDRPVEMRRRERLCLENGGREFWVVDPDKHRVKVSRTDGLTKTYSAGDSIPLTSFGGDSIEVDEIFVGII